MITAITPMTLGKFRKPPAWGLMAMSLPSQGRPRLTIGDHRHLGQSTTRSLAPRRWGSCKVVCRCPVIFYYHHHYYHHDFTYTVYTRIYIYKDIYIDICIYIHMYIYIYIYI